METRTEEQFIDSHESTTVEGSSVLPAPSSDSTPPPVSLPPMSPEVERCVLERLGPDFKERLFSGALSPGVLEETIRACTEAGLQSDATQSKSNSILRAFIANAWEALRALVR